MTDFALFREFWRHRKYEHRNESLRRNAITQGDYMKMKNLLAESLEHRHDGEESYFYHIQPIVYKFDKF